MVVYQRIIPIIIILSISIYSWATVDESDTLSTIYLNNSVVISAQRHETDAFKRPESIAYLNKAQLKRLSPMSLPNALSHVPGVWMQKTNHGGGSPFIRGLTGNQVLILRS